MTRKYWCSKFQGNNINAHSNLKKIAKILINDLIPATPLKLLNQIQQNLVYSKNIINYVVLHITRKYWFSKFYGSDAPSNLEN